MGLFRSISAYFKSLGQQAGGTIDQAADRMRSDSDALKSKYADVIREKIKNLKDYRGALATMAAQKDKMLEKAKDLTEEVGKLEDMKAGAAAKVRQLVSSLKGEGKTDADIAADPEFASGKEHFGRFTEQLASKQAEITDLEQRAAELETKISSHKEGLKGMLAEIDKLKSEAAESVAEVAAAGEEAEARAALDGFGGSGANEELAKLREIRARSNAEARIAHELAGDSPDADQLTKEFLERAEAEASADDFASLVGLDAPSSSPKTEAPKPSDSAKPADKSAPTDPAKPAGDAAGEGDEFKFPE